MILELIQSIGEIERKYREGELAYISLTGKNESFIRDNLAFILMKKNKENGFSRETGRMDIVQFLSYEGFPNAKNIIELTSLYTTDLLNRNLFNRNYKEKIKKDFVKNKKYVSVETKTYNIIIATHLNGEIVDKYKHIVKYSKGLNKWRFQHGGENYKQSLIDRCEQTIKDEIMEPGITKYHTCIDAGEAFGISVDIHFWILEQSCNQAI